ncbi:MAG: glycoside hydrolase family 9 protein, partial [Candidatus Limnocylindrales bacterium]
MARSAVLGHAAAMRIGTPLALLLLALVVAGGGLLAPAPAVAQTRYLIRVDQAGYVLGRPMTAWVLAPSATPRLRFSVVDRRGRAALKGRTGRSTGRWNPRYRGVLPIDLSGIRRAGRYRVVLVGRPGVRSPWFRVGQARRILDPLIAATVSFLGDQRDGTDLVGRTATPAARHATDANASLYAWPQFVEGTEQVTADLVPLGSTTDVSGGWADAGDTVKLTHTTAYVDALLWAAARELGEDAPDRLLPEATHGLAWLERVWHPETGILDMQVGIGSGAADGSFVGDHDVWRRPETDTLRFAPEQRYLLHRPVFQANVAGAPLPPNLAGRVAAAFALAAQVRAGTDATEARRLLDLAAGVFDAAKVADVAATDVVTALPASWYPEASWRDDLAWAAAELALAGRRLDHARTAEWLDTGILL